MNRPDQATIKKLDQISIDTIRTLAMDAVQKANSGHPGTPMAMAPVAYSIRDGGGFGSIIGRNSCQRRRPEALAFLKRIIELYSGAQK